MLYKSAGAENAGYVIRKDWLDVLNMDVPKTYDAFEAYVEASNSTYGIQEAPDWTAHDRYADKLQSLGA